MTQSLQSGKDQNTVWASLGDASWGGVKSISLALNSFAMHAVDVVRRAPTRIASSNETNELLSFIDVDHAQMAPKAVGKAMRSMLAGYPGLPDARSSIVEGSLTAGHGKPGVVRVDRRLR